MMTFLKNFANTTWLKESVDLIKKIILKQNVVQKFLIKEQNISIITKQKDKVAYSILRYLTYTKMKFLLNLTEKTQIP